MELELLYRKRNQLRKQWQKAGDAERRLLEVRGRLISKDIELKEAGEKVKKAMFP